MKILTFDYETSIRANKPWLPKSYPVSLGIQLDTDYYEYIINHQQRSANFNPKEVQAIFNEADIIIAHNISFDLHWLRACGIVLKNSIKLYDTMIAEYIISGQTKTYQDLSLADLSDEYLETPKDDKVKVFWDAGYETDEIPLEILLPYMKRDILNTRAIYDLQQPKIKNQGLDKLVRLQSELAGVVEDMEWNGMKVNIQACFEKEQKCNETIASLNDELNLFIEDALPELKGIPVKWSSGDHLSAILFGGSLIYDGKETAYRTVQETYPEEVEWVNAKGFVKRKLKNFKRPVTKEYERKAKIAIYTEGLGFKPAKGTETKKEGYYQTNVSQIEQLKPKGEAQVRFLEINRELSSAEKLGGTYFKPFQEESVDELFHPQYNQTATVTGRLTASRIHQIPRSDDAGVKSVFISSFI